MSVGQEFWIVAAGCAGGSGDKESYFANLKSVPSLATKGQGPYQFEVPDGDRSLIFGSFDNLIRLTDDLQKYDGQVESVLHRLERQYLELDPKAVFKVKSQRQEKDFLEYLQKWQWDEAKYPKTRSISDNTTLLMQTVNRLDEEARNKTTQYSDFKQQRGTLAKKDGATLLTRDLVDVLTPEVVSMNGNENDDFIYTEHLTTVAVIVTRGSEQDFLKCYETLCEKIVPKSAKQFTNLKDKEGNTLWRVVMFESSAEAFKKQCRERRFVPRDFKYSDEGYKKLKVQRDELDQAVKRQHDIVRGLYQAAWSDAMVAWMHIKAMRIFVESVLRFGMPPRFASFILTPKPGAAVAARKSLMDILGRGGHSGPCDKMSEKQDDDDEFYPYVSLTFVPFAVQRG